MIDYKSPLSGKQMVDVAQRTRILVSKRLNIPEARISVTVTRGSPEKSRGQTFAYDVRVRIDDNDPTPVQSAAIGSIVLETVNDAVRWAISN